jgi:hypothetical protein
MMGVNQDHVEGFSTKQEFTSTHIQIININAPPSPNCPPGHDNSITINIASTQQNRDILLVHEKRG